VSWFNYSTPFVAAGLMSAINFFLVIFLFPETKQMLETIKFDLIKGLHNLRKVFFLKYLKWFFCAQFALSFGWAFFNEFVPVLLRERFSFNLSQIGEYYAFTGGCYAVGALLATQLVHRFDPEKFIIVSLLIAATCMSLFAVVFHSYFLWMIVPLMMTGLACSYPTATTLVSNRTNPQNQGEVLGVMQSVAAAAMGLSPLFVGSAVGAYPPLTAWGGALSLILAAFSFWMGKYTRIKIKNRDV
jgi:DHA1 family tetracycline resistance protein-like MFS transporter